MNRTIARIGNFELRRKSFFANIHIQLTKLKLLSGINMEIVHSQFLDIKRNIVSQSQTLMKKAKSFHAATDY